MDEMSWIRAQVDMLAVSAYCSARSTQTRCHKKEPLIALNPQVAYLYALKVMRGRFKQAEPLISTNAEWSVRYARFVLKGRFVSAEKTISKDPMWALEYACKVVGGRLPSRMHAVMLSMRGDPFAEKYMEFQLKSAAG